jgi:hypothetical protein
MKNEFIPYEQALALKELGFDEPCFRGYTEEYKTLINFSNTHTNSSVKNTLQTKPFTAPLYQQAFRWFREKYNLHSYIEGAYPWFRFYINSEDDRYEGHKHLSFPETELECLKKLIEIVKNK